MKNANWVRLTWKIPAQTLSAWIIWVLFWSLLESTEHLGLDLYINTVDDYKILNQLATHWYVLFCSLELVKRNFFGRNIEKWSFQDVQLYWKVPFPNVISWLIIDTSFYWIEAKVNSAFWAILFKVRNFTCSILFFR